MRKRIAALVAVACCALVLPASAAAHATLLQTTPADRAVLATPPHEVRFVFDDTVRVASGTKAVRNGGGSVLAGKPHVVGGRTLVVPLTRIGDGDYTVLWRIVSDDGHNEAGVIAFAVGAGRAPPTPSFSASSGPSAREVVSRWLFFAGLLVAAGGALFRLVTGVGRTTLLVPAFVAAFLGASGLLPHHGTFATRFGVAYAIAAIVAGLGATAAAISFVEPRARAVAWALALVLLPLPTFAGHALDAGVPRIDAAVDVLHLAAAAAWTGGLVQLALALRGEPAAGNLLRRFSTLALASVLLLAATGVVRALAELRSVSQVWTTGYGRLLIVKTALLGLLVAVGWLNRYRLVPRGRVGALRRSSAVELVLLTGVVVAVAILTDARPGRDHLAVAAATGPPPLPPRDAVVLAQEDGDDGVTLAAQPDRILVTIFDGQGLGVNGLDVAVAGTPATSCGAGCYEAQTNVRGAVPVVVGGKRLMFHLPRRTPAGAALVARAGRTFRSLRSVTYVERLASSPSERIVTTFRLEAPDRVEYRIHGGASGIVIGTRRWDGNNGNWTRSASTVLPQPTPAWGTRVTNAHVLGRTRDAVVVSFLNPVIPAWFVARLDPRTLRPHTLEMTATAHFMHHTYTRFNTPRRIFPPTG